MMSTFMKLIRDAVNFGESAQKQDQTTPHESAANKGQHRPSAIGMQSSTNMSTPCRDYGKDRYLTKESKVL